MIMILRRAIFSATALFDGFERDALLWDTNESFMIIQSCFRTNSISALLLLVSMIRCSTIHGTRRCCGGGGTALGERRSGGRRWGRGDGGTALGAGGRRWENADRDGDTIYGSYVVWMFWAVLGGDYNYVRL